MPEFQTQTNLTEFIGFAKVLFPLPVELQSSNCGRHDRPAGWQQLDSFTLTKLLDRPVPITGNRPTKGLSSARKIYLGICLKSHDQFIGQSSDL